MNPSDMDGIVYGHRVSTVVPASITEGEEKMTHKLTNADLAMKLHYVRGVYLFRSLAVEGLSAVHLKDSLFPLLNSYYPAAGRIRRSPPEGGRPFIKCNDSGVRVVEAECQKTVDGWLALTAGQSSPDPYDRLLRRDHFLGRDDDLAFSPLLFIQLTWFKCGGVSVGVSWAHVLGDPFSVSEFFTKMGQLVAGAANLPPPLPVHIPAETADNNFPSSLGRIPPVGELWDLAPTSNMVTNTYHFSTKQIGQLLLISKSFFNAIAAVIWKSLAKVRRSPAGLKTVTVIKAPRRDGKDELRPAAGNWQAAISVVKVTMDVAEADVAELAEKISENAEEENGIIEEFAGLGENNVPSSDFYVYGANLTFVDLEGAKIYEFELKGQKPIYANYTIGGVGEEGAVLVLPEDSEGGRIVNVTLPEHLGQELANDLKGILGN
ncbi:hypothetical protein DM860_017115 [Cuscuta australis]|uniref:Uncharacterized protein n=1 Tax=Cuscuta australis TaxID=267555 RepID=A0A328DN95_9ASTE|nr:hypothetical protein DM860_017115 [Cuscuta australis]